MWQLYQKALPLRGNLPRRGLNIDPVCPVCIRDIESAENLFKECQRTNKV